MLVSLYPINFSLQLGIYLIIVFVMFGILLGNLARVDIGLPCVNHLHNQCTKFLSIVRCNLYIERALLLMDNLLLFQLGH